MTLTPPPAATARAWLPPLVAGLAAFVLYSITLAPGLVGGDSPEMIVAAHEVGIPHQPGYPLYVLVGRVLTLLPVGDTAYAVNLLSALAGGAATAAMAALLTRLALAPWVAALLALVPALSRHTWSQAVVAEVYTLGLFLGLAALLLFDRWRTGGETRTLLFAAYVGGLAVGHQPLTVMLLAAVVLVLIGRLVTKRASLGAAGGAVLTFCLPFTLFVLLPIRSAGGAIIDYARIEKAGDFFYHAFGVASRSKLLDEGTGGVVETLGLMWATATSALGPPTLLLVLFGLAGAVIMAMRDRERLVLFWLPLLLIVGFSLLYAIHDIENYLIIPFWLLTLSAGVALAALKPARVVSIVSVALAVVLLFFGHRANHAAVNRADYHIIDDFVANTFTCVPENGALFLFMETLVGPFLHHQAVEGARPDVTLVDMSGKVIREPYGFRGMTGDWREKRWQRMENLFVTPPPSLRGKPMVTLTTEVRGTDGKPFAYRRRGVAHELVRPGAAPVPVHPYWERFAVRLPSPRVVDTEVNTFMLTPLIFDMYADTALEAAAEYLRDDDLDGAARIFRSILDFSPKSSLPRTALADIYRRQGRFDAAAEQLEVVLKRSPQDVNLLNAIGVIRLSQGNREEAESLFRRSIAISPEYALARLNLADLLAGDPARGAEAIQEYRLFLGLAPNDPSAPRVRSLLERVQSR